jgi:hypothetical protein
MNKLRNLLYELIEKDDENRDLVRYDLGDSITKIENKIRKLKLIDLIEKD